MKKWYGSLENRLMENMTTPTIEVGMGVTKLSWSDRHPYEVIEVVDQKHITIREMKYKRILEEGECAISDSQEYEYFSNPNGYTIKCVFRNGCWYSVTEFTKAEWLEMAKTDDSFRTPEVAYNYYRAMAGLTEKQLEKIEQGKPVKKYSKINICIGVMEKYYDYSF